MSAPFKPVTLEVAGAIVVVKPAERIIIRCPNGTRAPEVRRIAAMADAVLGRNRAMVLTPGFDIAVAEPRAKAVPRG